MHNNLIFGYVVWTMNLLPNMYLCMCYVKITSICFAYIQNLVLICQSVSQCQHEYACTHTYSLCSIQSLYTGPDNSSKIFKDKDKHCDSFEDEDKTCKRKRCDG